MCRTRPNSESPLLAELGLIEASTKHEVLSTNLRIAQVAAGTTLEGQIQVRHARPLFSVLRTTHEARASQKYHRGLQHHPGEAQPRGAPAVPSAPDQGLWTEKRQTTP